MARGARACSVCCNVRGNTRRKADSLPPPRLSPPPPRLPLLQTPTVHTMVTHLVEPILIAMWPYAIVLFGVLCVLWLRDFAMSFIAPWVYKASDVTLSSPVRQVAELQHALEGGTLSWHPHDPSWDSASPRRAAPFAHDAVRAYSI